MEKKIIETSLLARLEKRLAVYTNDDGNFEYPEGGTGSALKDLLAYATKNSKEKPIDYEIFYDFLVNNMNVPSHFLFRAAPIWKNWKE
jgi:hypothetical protein